MSDSSDTSALLLVRDLMTVGVPTCALDTSVIDLTRLMLEKDWGSIVVLESDQGHAVGVVTRDDILRAYARSEAGDLSVEQIMQAELPTVPPDIPLSAAAQIMIDMGVPALYMTHHAGGIEYPAAWLTEVHLLRHMVGDKIDDLGIQADREPPLETFLKRRDEARRRAGLSD